MLDDGTHVRAPIAGVVAGLRAAANDVCVVLPVDTPRLTSAALLELASVEAQVAIPQTGPLPGTYRRGALPALEAALAAGRLSLRDALVGLDRLVVEIDPALLVNVNTPDELARI